MQNVKEKQFPITLDIDRNLKFANLAFIEMEEKYGSVEDALPVFESAMINNRFKDLTYFYWLGLIHEDEHLTERKVACLLTPRLTAAYAADIMQAFKESLPQAKGDEKNQNPVPKAEGGTGTGSTTSGP